MIPSNPAPTPHLIAGEARRLPPHLNEMLGTPCFVCGQPLDFQVPNPQDADRLLAICLDCGAWHGIDVAPDGNAAIIIHLPDVRSYWEACEKGQGQSPSADPRPAATAA